LRLQTHFSLPPNIWFGFFDYRAATNTGPRRNLEDSPAGDRLAIRTFNAGHLRRFQVA
jgi:hypothetical protein